MCTQLSAVITPCKRKVGCEVPVLSGSISGYVQARYGVFRINIYRRYYLEKRPLERL